MLPATPHERYFAHVLEYVPVLVSEVPRCHRQELVEEPDARRELARDRRAANDAADLVIGKRRQHNLWAPLVSKAGSVIPLRWVTPPRYMDPELTPEGEVPGAVLDVLAAVQDEPRPGREQRERSLRLHGSTVRAALFQSFENQSQDRARNIAEGSHHSQPAFGGRG